MLETISILHPQISGIKKVENKSDMTSLTLNESLKEIPIVHLYESGKYHLNIHCAKNTKNILFLHAQAKNSQEIRIKLTLEKGSDLCFIHQADICKSSKVNIHISVSCKGGSHFNPLYLFRSQEAVEFLAEHFLEEESAKSSVQSIYLGRDESNARIQILNKGVNSNTSGNIQTRSILLDSSKCFLEGVPEVSKGAKNCSSHLEQKSLLLGEKARSISLPKLSIANNEVEASHSSSVSNFSQEDLYFLQSRGLNVSDATELLVEAFSSELIQKIPSDEMQKCLEEKLKTFLCQKKF